MKYLLLILTLFSSIAYSAGAPISTGKFGRVTPQFYVDVAKGAVTGHSAVNVTGHAALSTAYQTVWDCTVLPYVWPASDLAMTVVSDDPNDNSTGTGAQTVTIEGFDADWIPQTATVSLTGVTPVAIPGTWIRINKSFVATAGATGGAIGEITVANGGTTYSCIQNGYNVSIAGYYSVPAGYYALLLQGTTSAEAGKSAEVDVYARVFGGAFQLAHHAHIYQNYYTYDFKAIQLLPPKSDIDVRAVSTASGSEISVIFDILLVREDLLDARQ